MRAEESSKNAITEIIFYIVNSILEFISRTVIIHFLGIEFSGLNSLFKNILGVLNITELGLSQAVAYSLYKPLANKDTKTINEVLKLYKYLYRIIAAIIAVFGLCVVIFLPNIVNTNIDISQIRIAFILYLLSTVFSYVFTFLNVLPTADQKNYFVTRIQGFFKVVKSIIQLIIVIIFRNYFLWLIIEILGNILSYIYTNWKIKKKYEYYEETVYYSLLKLLKKYKAIIYKVRDLFFHRIGGLAVYQTDNIVISYFCTLADVGIYENYMLIATVISGVFDHMFTSITSSIGNLIIERGKESAYKVWKELHTLTVFLSPICCFLYYILINKFITLWVGKDYILANAIVFAITLNIMFKIIKQPIDKFKDAFGIFGDRMAPFMEAVINLVASVILAKIYGIIGVVIGTIISNIIITAIWKPYVVFKQGFHVKFIEYIKINIPLLIISIISIELTNFVVNIINLNLMHGWLGLIVTAIVYGIITVNITLACFMVYKPFRKIFKKYYSILIQFIMKFIKKSVKE